MNKVIISPMSFIDVGDTNNFKKEGLLNEKNENYGRKYSSGTCCLCIY
ncbi:hypothetical protein [Clostridium estertheticum]|nr:hypothetical protein [Clostridium estertheticum]MBU3162385.1 hypothetical protein [Clostridium estertheticum]MBX4261871.1 hypothetical protein [Clostridium estertheticum]MBX4264814.1 hypothetical protein [Clostridium estertheticum]MBX4269667.1 hypothetical protein [Clostridium estertheticum]MCB2343738.1 hypothetical protein [Clostridium estertheticum]